jgi:hypothetical protein
MPISMALTEWHFVLLYEDKIRVIGLLSDKVVYEEALDLVSQSHAAPALHTDATGLKAAGSSTSSTVVRSSAQDALDAHEPVHLRACRQR